MLNLLINLLFYTKGQVALNSEFQQELQACRANELRFIFHSLVPTALSYYIDYYTLILQILLTIYIRGELNVFSPDCQKGENNCLILLTLMVLKP